MRRTVLAAVAAAVAAAAPAGAADTPITTVERPTEIRSWDGVAALNVFRDGRYHLAIVRGLGAPELVPVAPRSVPFDLDVGPDSENGPAIVYSRCAVERQPGVRGRRDCDLYRYSVRRGVEAKIRNADSDTASEVRPTIWYGRIAFARTADGARGEGRATIYTRSLTAPRSVRSRRLPGAPQRRCGFDGECGPTKLVADPELELWGGWLGMVVAYDAPGQGGVCGRWEVRLTPLSVRRHGPPRRIDDVTCGLNGQTLRGISFSAGRAFWVRSCAAEPSCGRAHRYRISRDSFEEAPQPRRLTGWSYAGLGRAYEVRADDTRDGYCGNALPGTSPPCSVVRVDGLPYAPRK